MANKTQGTRNRQNALVAAGLILKAQAKLGDVETLDAAVKEVHGLLATAVTKLTGFATK